MDYIILLTIAGAFFLDVSVGFGGGLLAIPLISLFIEPLQAIYLILIFQFLKGALVFSNYRDVDWGLLLKILPGMVLGTLAGLFFATQLSLDLVRLSLSSLLLIYVVQKRFFNGFFGTYNPKIGAAIPGAIGGFIMGGFGIGGPIYVMYYKEKTKDQITFRATLIATFALTNFIRIISAVVEGVYDNQMLQLALYGLPVFIFSLFLGQKYHKDIPKILFENIVDALLVLSSLSLLVKIFI